MKQPVNPVFPYFSASCAVCGGHTDSLHAVTGEKPFTFECSSHQTQELRDAVWRNTNEQVSRARFERPSAVAFARRQLGIKRPRRVLLTPDWEGCGVEA